MRRNREAALQQLQLRNDRERKQRDIELLARDNELKSAALANRELMLRVWAVAAAGAGAAGGGGRAALPPRARRPTAGSSPARRSCACRASATR